MKVTAVTECSGLLAPHAVRSVHRTLEYLAGQCLVCITAGCRCQHLHWQLLEL